jgi:hypothetical protein
MPNKGSSKDSSEVAGLLSFIIMIRISTSSASVLTAVPPSSNSQIVSNGFLVAYGSHVKGLYNISVRSAEMRVKWTCRRVMSG